MSTNPSDLVREARDRGSLVVLDGALGTELEARGCDLHDPLWSARVLVDEPDVVEAVHRDYLDAGARVVTTASYQATPLAMRARDLDERSALDLVARSVRLADAARRARLEARPDAAPLLVAGSVGPYGGYLADGSEYRGDYELPHADMLAFHRSRIAALADAGADVIACETIPQLAEAKALLELVDELDVPAWFSFTLRDETHASDGTPLADIAALVDGHPNVLAVGVNCVPIERVAPALEALAARTSTPLVAYPNSGEVYDGATRTWRAAPSGGTLAARAEEWRGIGAVLVGGCCRTTPRDIAALAIAARS